VITINTNININERYFLMSFRFDKSSPEEFGLIQSQTIPKVFINVKDGSRWVKRALFDYGWGSENGFVRLPELDFEELIYLIEYSNIKENKYGAAIEIERKFAEELLQFLLELFNKPEYKISNGLRETFEILGLEQCRNRSITLGKHFEEENNDYQKWKLISTKIKEIL
jgi:hypothetical protein